MHIRGSMRASNTFSSPNMTPCHSALQQFTARQSRPRDGWLSKEGQAVDWTCGFRITGSVALYMAKLVRTSIVYVFVILSMGGWHLSAQTLHYTKHPDVGNGE